MHIPNNRVDQSILLGTKKPNPDDLDVLRRRRPKLTDPMSLGQIKASLETPDPLSYASPFIVGSSQQESPNQKSRSGTLSQEIGRPCWISTSTE